MTEKKIERKTDLDPDTDLAFLRAGGAIRLRFTLSRDPESPTGFTETSEKIYEIPRPEDEDEDGEGS